MKHTAQLRPVESALSVCTMSVRMPSQRVFVMPPRARSRRIDVRVTDEQDAIIREAAAVAGQTVTAFLLGAAEERARAILDERRHLVMTDRTFAAFAAALDAPGEHVPAMSELFRLPRISSE